MYFTVRICTIFFFFFGGFRERIHVAAHNYCMYIFDYLDFFEKIIVLV